MSTSSAGVMGSDTDFASFGPASSKSDLFDLSIGGLSFNFMMSFRQKKWVRKGAGSAMGARVQLRQKMEVNYVRDTIEFRRF